MRYFMAAAAIALALPLSAASAPTHVVVDAKGNVERFYGVPIDLTISHLKRLPYRMKMGHEYEELDRYVTATITAENGVQVEVSFGSDGRLYRARTMSRN